ncbi:MAG: hypothetical protein ABW321_08530 [Polyangiales bacterium]
MAVPFKRRRCLWIAALLAAALSCKAAEGAQLVVVVNSSLASERELAAVTLRVDGRERAHIELGAGASSIPFSFGVSPPGGDVGARVTIEAVAHSPDGVAMGCPARAQVGFSAGESRRVMLALTHACSAGSCACEDSETCVEGECKSAELDVDSLPLAEPGRELEGVEPLADTTLGAPERALCQSDNGPWHDVARALTRTHDDVLCPVMSDGTEWGSDGYSLDMNRQALSDYIDRQVAVGHDVVTLHVVMVDDALRVVGRDVFDIQALQVPTLEEALQHPTLQAAEQPLQLVVREDDLMRSTFVATLPRILLDSGVVRECRPIYLTASGPGSFAALRELRGNLRVQPRWQPLWNLVHFGRRLVGTSFGAALVELDEAAALDLDYVGIAADRDDFPALRRSARALHLEPWIYEAFDATQVASLCDGSSGVATLLSTERPPEILYRDELRYQVSTARTLLELDVSGLQADATGIPYRSIPEIAMPRVADRGAATPELVMGDDAAIWGDLGAVLRFSAAGKQSLALSDATYNVERPERRYFAWPRQVLMVTARLPIGPLAEGERQVLVSKLRGESGWALAYVNEGSGRALKYQWYGRHRESGVVTALEGAVELAALPWQVREPFTTIYVQDHRIGVGIQQAAVIAPTDVMAYNQHVMVTNDAPITLGADPDGGGYFNGEIQAVKVLAAYEGPEDF